MGGDRKSVRRELKNVVVQGFENGHPGLENQGFVRGFLCKTATKALKIMVPYEVSFAKRPPRP